MTVPREEIARKVRRWIAYAEDDLILARHGLTLGPHCPFRLVAYHAQQCAEKCLKAFLVWKGIDFPTTHNIARLLELVETQAVWAGCLKEAVTLTPFAITTRYPVEDSEVEQQEAERAILVAERVRETVRQALRSENLFL